MRILLLRLVLGTLATAVVLLGFLLVVGSPAPSPPDAIPSCVPAPWCRV
jgi:hypothetical protein